MSYQAVLRNRQQKLDCRELAGQFQGQRSLKGNSQALLGGAPSVHSGVNSDWYGKEVIHWTNGGEKMHVDKKELGEKKTGIVISVWHGNFKYVLILYKQWWKSVHISFNLDFFTMSRSRLNSKFFLQQEGKFF